MKMYFYSFLKLSVLTFFCSLYFLINFKEVYFEYDLLMLNSLSVKILFFFDWVSLIFMSFVFFISSMIILYSLDYMNDQKAFKRFFHLVILFVVSMMMMIMSPNLITILLGWDGLGLVSYVLVIYYQNVKSFNAGMLTALSNRIGDASLLMSIACMSNFGSWNYMHYLDMFKMNKIFIMVILFIILASMTKSAQIPFSAWLPAAMAAPTPVSSLVHSSTLVTAGVYLLFRFSSSFSYSVNMILLYLSLLTMFMAGLAANFEYDLKKIIALSTLSQLGMMITILCLGGYNLAFFHLLMHALFKALLFMCAGVMIHNLDNCQDIRFMGGMLNYLPISSTCFMVSNFALCGLPFLSGFYSKDLIAEFLSLKFLSISVYMIFFLSVGLTVAYSMRLSYYIFFGEFNMLNMNYLNDENNLVMVKSMLGLVFMVIFKGAVLVWIMFPIPYFIVLPMFMKFMTIIMIMMGGLIGYEMFYFKYNFKKFFCGLNLFMFTSGMWNMPILSTMGLNYFFLKLSKLYYKNFDLGWMEFYGSKNLFFNMKMLIQNLQLFSINHLKMFLFMIYLFYLFILIFI